MSPKVIIFFAKRPSLADLFLSLSVACIWLNGGAYVSVLHSNWASVAAYAESRLSRVNASRLAAGVAISWRILYLAAYGKMERKWVLVEIFSDCVGCLLFEALLGGWQIWGLQSA